MAEIIKPKVYIDTSVISYLTSKPSRDIITLAHQQITHEWWEQHRSKFDLYISNIVVEEAKLGDPEAVEKRLNIIGSIQIIKVGKEAEALANLFINKKALPEKATNDASHIALATVHNIDYLITWNLKHIANVDMRKVMLEVSNAEGYKLPIICTPEELSESFGEK